MTLHAFAQFQTFFDDLFHAAELRQYFEYCQYTMFIGQSKFDQHLSEGWKASICILIYFHKTMLMLHVNTLPAHARAFHSLVFIANAFMFAQS